MQSQQEALSGPTGAHPGHVLMPDTDRRGAARLRAQWQQGAHSGLTDTHPDWVLVLEMGGLPTEVGPPICVPGTAGDTTAGDGEVDGAGLGLAAAGRTRLSVSL